MSDEWQMVSADRWVFGERQRGIVRYAKAEVAAGPAIGGAQAWAWYVYAGQPSQGIAERRTEAIEAAERALGIGYQ